MKSRVLVPELMDDPSIDPTEHRRALRGLRRVNGLCQTGKHLANEILRIAAERKRDSLSVLDLGCGSGDVATDVGRRLFDRIQCDISGWDISPTAIGYANEFLSARRKKWRREAGRFAEVSMGGAQSSQHSCAEARGTCRPAAGPHFIRRRRLR